MEFTLLRQTKMKSSASRSPARCLLGGAESCRTGRAAQSTATLLRGCGQQRGQRGQQQLFEKQKVRTAGRCARLCLLHAALEAGGAAVHGDEAQGWAQESEPAAAPNEFGCSAQIACRGRVRQQISNAFFFWGRKAQLWWEVRNQQNE